MISVKIFGLVTCVILSITVILQYVQHLISLKQSLGRCQSIDSGLGFSSSNNVNKKIVQHMFFYLCLLIGVAVDIPFLVLSLAGAIGNSFEGWRLMAHLQLCCLLIPIELTVRDWTNILRDPHARWYTPGMLRHVVLCGWLGVYLVYATLCTVAVIISSVPGGPDGLHFLDNRWAFTLGMVLREGASWLVCAAFLHAGWCLRVRIIMLEAQTTDPHLKLIRDRLTFLMGLCTGFVFLQALFFLLDGMMINIVWWDDDNDSHASPWFIWLPLISWLPGFSVTITMLYLSRPPHEEIEEANRQRSVEDPHGYVLLEDNNVVSSEDKDRYVSGKLVRQLSGGGNNLFGRAPSHLCESNRESEESEPSGQWNSPVKSL